MQAAGKRKAQKTRVVDEVYTTGAGVSASAFVRKNTLLAIVTGTIASGVSVNRLGDFVHSKSKDQ